jgi:hypothetical protein
LRPLPQSVRVQQPVPLNTFAITQSSAVVHAVGSRLEAPPAFAPAVVWLPPLVSVPAELLPPLEPPLLEAPFPAVADLPEAAVAASLVLPEQADAIDTNADEARIRPRSEKDMVGPHATDVGASSRSA